MEQILLSNAFCAWKNAIYYHDKIENGFSSLENQKGFVSSLHNAVELFLKQIMINNHDTNVVTINKPKSEEDAKLLLEYYQATDLNSFFENLSPVEMCKLYSIGFSNLIDKANNLLEISKENKKQTINALNLLQELRNNETHFYINNSNYLAEGDFIVLHNFMIVFYQTIAHKGLLPCRIDVHFGGVIEEIKILKEFSFLEFNRTEMQSFSYRDALINNPLTIEIKNMLIGDYNYLYSTLNIYNCYRLAEVMLIYEEKHRDKFYDVFVLLELMKKYCLYGLEKDENESDTIKVYF